MEVLEGRRWRDRSRAKRNTVSTFRWWTVVPDGCESFKQIDGQVENFRRKCFYFVMMNCCCWSMCVLYANWWRGGEPKEKLLLLCDDELLLLMDLRPSKKLMDMWRTERENVYTLRWWSVAANRCESFKQIDGQVENRSRNSFYFAMLICCCWRISVLQGHLLRGREPKETPFQDCGDQLLVLLVCVLWVNLAGASWRKQELFLSFLYTIYLLS